MNQKPATDKLLKLIGLQALFALLEQPMFSPLLRKQGKGKTPAGRKEALQAQLENTKTPARRAKILRRLEACGR